MSDAAAPAPARAADGSAAVGQAAGGAGGTTSSEAGAKVAGSGIPAERAVIRTAQLVVRVKDVTKAATAAAARATAARGLVADQQIGSDQQARLTLRVPSDQLDSVVADLVALGTRVSENRQSSDVTAQVVDVASRVSSQQASLARLRALMAKAVSVGDIVQIEGELTKREADLESLLAQQKKLADQTTLASIDLTLLGPEGVPPTTTKDEHGFLVGLREGWDGLVSFLTVVVTVVGVVLPFAALAALVGVPAVVVYRRARRARQPADGLTGAGGGSA